MIRILHLITSLNVGGAETQLYQLLSRSNGTQFHHAVISMLDIGPIGEKIKALHIPVYSLRMNRGMPDPFAFAHFLRVIRAEKPNILQTWMYHADLFGAFVVGWRRDILLVWNVRASNVDIAQYRLLSGWTIRVCSWMSGLPRAVVANSQAGQVAHTNLGYHPRQWVIIPNGFDLSVLSPLPRAREDVFNELCISSDTVLIGLVARFDPMKDHLSFFRAAGLLLRENPNVHFVLVGNGITSHNPLLVQWIEQEGLTGHIHLLGPRDDIPRLTAALDISSSSSSYGEGFSNTVGEAMACGVPCVVTDVGDSALIVGDAGIVVPPRDPSALAEGWRKLIRLGGEGRTRLGRDARELIQRYYSLDIATEKYQNLYASLVQEYETKTGR